MFHVLIESGARPGAPAGWAMASLAAHATLIAGAVAVTLGNGQLSDDKIRPLPPLVFVQPPEPQPLRVGAPATGPSIPVPSVPTIPLPTIPPIDPVGTQPLPVTRTEDFGAGPVTTTKGTAGLPSGGIYTDRLVDRPVIAVGHNGSPEYPGRLRASSLEGDVTVRFVVDSTGSVEPGSVAIITSTHSLFGEAVRRWLLRTRYIPADVAGHAVRQLVEQRVYFTLRP